MTENHKEKDLKLSLKKLDKEIFNKFHNEFFGDTFNACMDCGGKCEKYSICTLIPGELDYLSFKMKISINELKDRYLDEINTPFGKVEVLKMVNGCPLLDENNNCSIKEIKPILCDTYPIIAKTSGDYITFEIDTNGCMMAKSGKYPTLINYFEEEGIRLLRNLDIPIDWWRIVELYDSFDFDYESIENQLRDNPNFQSFYIEELLGHTCNESIRDGRDTGLDLIKNRLKIEVDPIIEELSYKISKTKDLTQILIKSYRDNFKDLKNTVLNIINEAKSNDQTYSEEERNLYMFYIRYILFIIKKIKNDYDTYKIRIKEFERIENNKITDKRGLEDKNSQKFYSQKFIDHKKNEIAIDFFEITNGFSVDTLKGYIILSQNFGPEELDSPNFISREINRGKAKIKLNGDNTEEIIFYYIVLIVKDSKGETIGIADGTLITRKQLNVFFISHIAIIKKYRSLGIGAIVNDKILEIAKKYIKKLKNEEIPTNSNLIEGLSCEISEVEFPSKINGDNSTIKRLKFHGKMKRFIFWPLLYAQPDTNYLLTEFRSENWNSVPMFLSFRTFDDQKCDLDMVLKIKDLLLDYFSKFDKEGSEWDRKYLNEGLKKFESPKKIFYPDNYENIKDFVEETGWAFEILLKYYPEHKYTLDRKRFLTLISKS
ncbi:MAG: YkgJ family cysteine cluster protein [Promethearchaeota archaeon]